MAYKDKTKRKEYMKKYRKQYRRDNPEQRKAEAKRLRDKRKKYTDDYKLLIGCQICGYNKCVEALEFHHFDGDKDFTISTGKNKGWKRIKEEINKCIVLCANCHAEIRMKLEGR